MVLIRRSDDVDRECLLLAGVAASSAVTERARVTIAPSDDCHLWRHGSTVLSGAASSAESIGSHSGDVSWVCCLARRVWGIYLWWFIPYGSAGLIVLALLAGHMYGLPAFLAVLLASLLMDRG